MALIVTHKSSKISLLQTGSLIPVEENGSAYIIQAWGDELDLMRKWLPYMDWHIAEGASYTTGTVSHAMAQMATIFWNHNVRKARAAEASDPLAEQEKDKDKLDDD